eukprot:TRINITY_DN54704_c0_g1_i1.p1 TRINITY_DN54704_c0_g1~~TRINITY_DN54704_c0_g1_i1.p1  ORF type:complete len:503 (-),score=48.76 TRINITY_DN54704_c0_g1_i1:28-1536(-)
MGKLSPSREPRYVLCGDDADVVGDDPITPPSKPIDVPFGLLGTLRVFAASLVSSGMMRAPMILDSPKNWTVALPGPLNDNGNAPTPFDEHVKTITEYDATRMSGLSPATYRHRESLVKELGRYAKCFGRALLPRSVNVRCRALHPDIATSPWIRGRLQYFDTGALRQNFIRCGPLPMLSDTHEFPGYLNIEADVRVLNGPSGVARFRLCRVRHPPHAVSFCTLPMYGLERMKKALPSVLDDWLAYHFEHVGFAHGEFYDIDGSFSTDLQAWQDAGFSISYWKQWPKWLSHKLGELSALFRGCTESMAIAHCLATQRAHSRSVMLIPGLDVYIANKVGASQQNRFLPKMIRTMFKPLEGYGPIPAQIIFRSWPFARGGPSPSSRQAGVGSIISSSTLRSGTLDESMNVPLIDPDECTCASPHTCVSEWNYMNIVGAEATEDTIVAHHYLEMFPWDAGRCNRLFLGMHLCDVPDDSLLWATTMLQDKRVEAERVLALKAAWTLK